MNLRSASVVVVLISGPLVAESTLRFYEVTRRPSWEPTITEAGEIVYLGIDSDGFPNAFSSRAGQVTYSRTGVLRFPHVGEEGEIVFADQRASSPRFEIWSSSRGRMSELGGNLPSISSTGEICYLVQEGSSWVIRSSNRGNLVTLEAPVTSSCDLNKSGEVVYRDRDEDGRFQIFSTVRGQMTNGDRGLLGSPAINDKGDVVFVDSGELHSVADGQITDSGGGVGFYVDINSRGDIVLALRRGESYRIVVATQSQVRYSELPLLEPSIQWMGPILDIEVAIAPTDGMYLLPNKTLGVIPVVLLSSQISSTESLDATLVDELSVRLGPARATILVRSMAERADVDGDGDIDLVLWFDPEATGLDCDASSGSVTGKMKDGRRFSGTSKIERPLC